MPRRSRPSGWHASCSREEHLLRQSSGADRRARALRNRPRFRSEIDGPLTVAHISRLMVSFHETAFPTILLRSREGGPSARFDPGSPAWRARARRRPQNCRYVLHGPRGFRGARCIPPVCSSPGPGRGISFSGAGARRHPSSAPEAFSGRRRGELRGCAVGANRPPCRPAGRPIRPGRPRYPGFSPTRPGNRATRGGPKGARRSAPRPP